MHNIQRKILNKLLYAESLAYAQMRPDGVESNHFAYHLDQLVRGGIVGKKDKAYFLTPDGLALVDRMSQEKMVDRLQPHIVTAIRLKNSDGHTLLYKRNFQPYIYRVGLPLGKVHYDESVLQAAKRELLEKCGLIGMPLTHRGMAYIEAHQQGVTISKVFYHLFTGITDEEPQQTNTLRGSSFWGNTEDYDGHDLMPGFRTLENLLNSNEELFFTEITEDLG